MNDLFEFLKENWIPLTTTIGAIWLYFSEKKKRHVEGRIGINDATEGMQNMYDKFVADADHQFEKLALKVKNLEESENDFSSYKRGVAIEITNMKREIELDKRRIIDLEGKIKEYEEQIQKYKEQVKNLNEELNKYKSRK